MNRLGLKLACVALAIVFWIQVASTTDTEATLALPVELVNLPPQYTSAGSEVPRLIDVRLYGSKLRLLAHKYLNRQVGRIQIDLSDARPAPSYSYSVSRSDVHTGLHTDLQVRGVGPSTTIRLRIDEQVVRRLPVAIELTGRLPEDRLFLEPISVTPDSVELAGPARFLAGISAVPTAPVELDRLDQSVTREQDLVSPEPLLVPMPSVVRLQARIARDEYRTLSNVPVVLLVDAGQPPAVVSPPVADVMVRGPADSVNALVPARLAVTIPLSGLSEDIYRLSGQVDHPDWLQVVALEPEQFMVIIGDAPSDSVRRQRP
jgi:YbbR domain-containing protein